ncbi:unnamed protein product [Orchesella dallaii]|uniref:Chitin-binding type-2 domain-containing protein n=1 Tax=Orchesella dallaii TaxID=48710 RepID=A0ABP1RLV5_9HEXA
MKPLKYSFFITTVTFLSFILLLGKVTGLKTDNFGTTPIGFPCTNTVECVGEPGVSSECRNNICLCKSGYLPSYGLDNCLPIVNLIGGECEESQQCQQGTPGRLSECVSEQRKSSCQCTSDGVNELCAHVCLQKAETVGDPCEVDIQCTANLGELSECSSGICACLPDAKPLPPGNNSCVPAKDGEVPIGNPCRFSTECVGSSSFTSECTVSGRCSCKPGFVVNFLMNQCLPIVNKLGGTCVESQQCQQGTPGTFSTCSKSNFKPNINGSICNCTSNAVNSPGGNECYTEAKLVGDSCIIHEQCISKLGPSQCIENQTAFVLLCLGAFAGVCLAQEGVYPECPATGTTQIAHPNCTIFIVCIEGRGTEIVCSLGLYYNPATTLCDFPFNVPECIEGTRAPLPPTTTRPTTPITEDPTDPTDDLTSTLVPTGEPTEEPPTEEPTEAPEEPTTTNTN